MVLPKGVEGNSSPLLEIVETHSRLSARVRRIRTINGNYEYTLDCRVFDQGSPRDKIRRLSHLFPEMLKVNKFVRGLSYSRSGEKLAFELLGPGAMTVSLCSPNCLAIIQFDSLSTTNEDVSTPQIEGDPVGQSISPISKSLVQEEPSVVIPDSELAKLVESGRVCEG